MGECESLWSAAALSQFLDYIALFLGPDIYKTIIRAANNEAFVYSTEIAL
jgi:hypothetical protein